MSIGAIAIGITAPEFESGVVGLADQAIQFVIVIGAFVRRIGVGRLRDAAGRIVGECAGVAAYRMGSEPTIGIEIARVHLAIFSTSSF